ncbi:acyl-CoA dehydrogenase family protein [Dethiobacter alkaliphilus]|uniref:Acyl-CoA dehydrogenase domain protein n=1 Tax=Dethiobacter alkaliphilus AHT 1 TaxID=555088 RepID=C0GEG6_DETAL|nr:acyl-CoA dehydrogenase family protein [Dethiobacter alkaliphilus]EEG78460.1 acyl-CoA dehydrogenase domain protein [Dethiobacter alkaliphilus AHT 1]
MFRLSAEQLAMQKMARDFTEKEIIPVAAEYDEQEKFPDAVIRKMWETGLVNFTVPEALGGVGLDTLTSCVLTEELGRGCAGITTVAAANSLALYPILIAGSEEQKKKFIPPITTAGKYAAFCLTEPNAGSDAASVATNAKAVDGGYVLNGSKCFITNGDVADLFVVFATVDKSKGLKGLTAFVVPKSDGVSAGKKEIKLGIRASSTVVVNFDNVFVPAENVLGGEGMGFKVAMQTLDTSRPLIGALSVGVARGAYESAVKYAKERVQFGQPIANFQMIQAMLANMATRIDASRLLVWRAADMVDQKDASFAKESAMAKMYASDVAMDVTTDAVQILGGYGYSREYPVEKYMRDAKIMQIYEGTNQIQRLVIAGNILR